MPAARNAGTSRLSVDDWIGEGYAIIAAEGLKALKIDRLCQRLGVTKGSFYWHFADMPTYRNELVKSWTALRDEERQFDDLEEVPPRERLSRMMTAFVGTHHWTMERAMREWARTDDDVAASVRTADRRLLDAVRQVFLDLGFDPDDADLRATATFAAGVGFIHLSGSTPSAREAARRERFLDLMLKP